MNWHIKKLIWFFIAAFLVIMISGVAIARDGELQVFKMGTDVTVLEKQVMTDAVAIGGNVTVLSEGEVTQDAVAIGGDVILKPNARIGGDAVAIGGQIIKEPGAMVGGDEVILFSNAGVLLDRFGLLGTLYITNALFYLAFSLFIFALGIFLLLLLPDRLQTITATIEQDSLKSGLWGLGSIVAIMLFTALFAGSLFGFLLIPVVNLAFAVAGLLGIVATALWIGKRILTRREKPFIPFFVGMLILTLISLIPIAGVLIVLMLDLFGLGAVWLSRVGTMPKTISRQLSGLDSARMSEG